MKKIFLLMSIFALLSTLTIKAQVTIGILDTPAKGALLDLKTNANGKSNLGFLPPRVELIQPSKPDPLPEHVQGMVVYNLSSTDSLKVGFYYNSGTRWVHLSADTFTGENWFYMPSIPINVTTPTPVDLYQKYVDQLNTAGGLVIKSAGAAPPKVLAAVPGRTDLYYYVTAYDPDVFDSIIISATGVMTYNIKPGAAATDATFLNIVFVEK